MDDFINFRKLIIPSIIKAVFWVSSILCITAGIVLIASSFGSYGSGATTFLPGLLITLLGPIVLRILCETIFVIFKIYENTHAIEQPKSTTSRTKKR